MTETKDKTYGKGWLQTDSLQWVRRIDETAYAVIETTVFDADHLVVGHFAIDLEDYKDADMEKELRPFGHEWTEEWRQSCGPDGAWRQIAAECIAENLMPEEGEEMNRTQYLTFLKRNGISVEGLVHYLLEEC